MTGPNLMRCSAKSKQTGEQCKRSAILGGTVCHWHGGAASQVKHKAEERIRELVHPALSLIAEILETGRAEDLPASVSLAAARDILDRAGYQPTQRLKVDARIAGEGHLMEVSELDQRIEHLLGRMAQLDDAGEGKTSVASGSEAKPANPTW